MQFRLSDVLTGIYFFPIYNWPLYLSSLPITITSFIMLSLILYSELGGRGWKGELVEKGSVGRRNVTQIYDNGGWPIPLIMTLLIVDFPNYKHRRPSQLYWHTMHAFVPQQIYLSKLLNLFGAHAGYIHYCNKYAVPVPATRTLWRILV